MDLQQRKLNKSEWESIEIPVSQDEQEVLRLIIDGYHNVNICHNPTLSLFTFMKMEVTPEIEDYLFHKFFAKKVVALVKQYKIDYFKGIQADANPTIKKADMIRLQKNTEETIEKAPLFEKVLLEQIAALLESKASASASASESWIQHYFTLYKLVRYHVKHVNRHVKECVKRVLDRFEDDVDFSALVFNAPEYIEKNEIVNRYADKTLYEHQKEIYTHSKSEGAKLVLYIAPTGTGKTLTPLGLSESHRVIFVCAARHVGLALARAAISCNKKVAFAFGCASAADIRLHYFAAKETTINRRTGGIWKVDNSVGDKVEIMICDIKSYLPAMYYMMAFNADFEIVTYWDEPTITMDYPDHEFHAIIQRNWSENKIPNMVLSSATLPKLHELTETLADFKGRFPGASVYNIVSHDCKKSIPLVNKHGYVVLPHLMADAETALSAIVSHCENYLTLLRYFDLPAVVDFLKEMHTKHGLSANGLMRFFPSLDDVTTTQIKLYYLRVLKTIDAGLCSGFRQRQTIKIAENEAVDVKGNRIDNTIIKASSLGPGVIPSSSSSNQSGAPLVRMASMPTPNEKPAVTATQGGGGGGYVTTKDAYTLTHGPTIFLASDVEKVAKFCIQQAAIPGFVMEGIVEKIQYNNEVNEKMAELEKAIEDANEKKNAEDGSADKKLHKLNREDTSGKNPGNKRLYTELEALRSMIKVSRLNDVFVPNTLAHLKKWTSGSPEDIRHAFKSDIEDAVIVDIMSLKNVADSWKVLLLMGVGVFTNHESIEYTEIMKKLADAQKLYLIIASSDYIYGTNYSFCHAYLSKDLVLTQEKIIQALGRVGRNRIQQEYTIRFRDDEHIRKIFLAEADKPEVANMNRLFSSSVE